MIRSCSLVPTKELADSVVGLSFGGSATHDWSGVSRRYRISSDGRLACNFAIVMAGAAGRSSAEPEDLLVALVLNKNSSAGLALEQRKHDMTAEVLDFARRQSDVPPKVLDEYWAATESELIVHMRESPRPGN